MKKAFMMRRLVLFTVLAVTGLVLTAPASADPAESTRVDLSFTTWARCAGEEGEPVDLEGFLHVTSSYTADAAGGFREHFHANVHLVGTGRLTGDRYVSTGAESIQGIYPNAGTSVVTWIGCSRDTKTGETTADDDFAVRIVLNPDGYSLEDEGCG